MRAAGFRVVIKGLLGISMSIALGAFGVMASEADETDTVTSEPLSNSGAFEKLKEGRDHICFFKCDDDFCFFEQHTHRYVTTHKGFLGMGGKKTKPQTDIIRKLVLRCPGPQCDHQLAFEPDELRTVFCRHGGITWRRMFQHFSNDHGWTIRVIASPAHSFGGSRPNFLYCLDKDGDRVDPSA